MTKEEFRKAWETEVVTWDQLADIAKEWGIAEKPRCMRLYDVRYLVLKAANVPDAEEFNPDYLDSIDDSFDD
jgi:Zn-dependent peptidase ImmA (M78 family)